MMTRPWYFQPDQLKEVVDFGIPEEPLNLDQLLVDCKDTLKYQVKTGETIEDLKMEWEALKEAGRPLAGKYILIIVYWGELECNGI